VRTFERFQTLLVVAFASAALMSDRAAHAAAIASDNACNSPYNGGSWTSGQNGGSGFGPWSLFQTGSGTTTFSAGSSANTGGGCSSSGSINGSCGKAWGEFVTNAAVANAVRAFTGSPGSLQAGQSFTFSIANGYVDNSGGSIGVMLENSSSNIVWEFLYIGGNPGGYYSIYDNSGTNDTSLGYETDGMVVAFMLTSSTTYSVTITQTTGPSQTLTGTLRSPAGGQGITQFNCFNNETLSGNGCSYDLFLNTISVSCPGFTVSAPTNQTVCVGNPASFSITTSATNSPSYQWLVSTNGGNTWAAVNSGSGGTTSNYTTAATLAGDNGSMFECAVTTACGNSVTSSVAALAVVTTASITTQPSTQTAYVGESASFTVGASAISYQWYEGPTGSGVALNNSGSVGGATSSTLTLSSLTASNSGSGFYVVVEGCGTAQTSTVAILNVTGFDPFLKANGLNIRNGRGSGDVVPLHGANLGAWLLMEGWMCPMDSSGLTDNYSVVSELDSRFGTNIEQSLIRTYQYNWITTHDLDNLRALGMNLVRVPFWWGDVETLSGAWRTDAFDRLDWVVSNAWARGIYTILDFHGVPGGQSSSADTGEANLNAYWTSTADQAATALIWSNIASHYAGNPAVAAYDLMNEPSGAPTQLALWYMYTNLYQVVRSVDPDHICLMQGAWNGTATNGQQVNWQWAVLPPPSMFGWSNVVYSMHSYAGSTSAVTNEVNKQTSDFVNHHSWNVPDYIGEFQGYGAGSCWQYTITNYDAYGMNWSTWAYKATAGTVPNSWGIYDPTSSGTPPTPNIQTSSSATISNDWTQSQTVDGFGIVPFEQQYLGGPLANANSYVATSGVTLVVGTGSGVLANAIDINEGQPGIRLQAVLVNGPLNGSLSLSTNGAFSYTSNTGFTGTDTFRYQVYDGWQLSVNIATASIQVTPPPVPAAPTGVTAGAGDGWVTISWNSSVANGYDVWRGTNSGGPYTMIATGLVSISYTDTSVVDGTTYYYVVTAFNAYGQSPYSAEVNATPLSAYQQWQIQYFDSISNSAAADNVDADGTGMSNLQKYQAGFNPTNPAAYLHLISIATSGANVVVAYLGASGDTNYMPGAQSRTNVLDFTTGDASGNYTNGDWQDTFQTNILGVGLTDDGSGGTALGTVTNMTDFGGATSGPSRYYRVRVLLP